MNYKKYIPLLYFFTGFGIFMFTRLSNFLPSIDPAIIIAPVLILRFIRTQPVKRGIWLTLLGFILSMNFALWGLFRFDEAWMTIIFGLIRSTLLAVIWFLPFMLDRILYPFFRKKGIAATLIFPIVTMAVFFLSSLEGPFDDGSGTLSSFGFGYGSLAFVQVRSLFGIWILIFIHSWLFSIINYCWEESFRLLKIRKLAVIYSVVIIMVFIFGFVKIYLINKPGSETVKIAAIVLIPEDGKAKSMSGIFKSRETSKWKHTLSRISKLTKKAVNNGAQIVSFQEFAMVINEDKENELREAYRKIANENNTILSITYAYFSKEGKGENKHLLIDAEGEILLDYAKRYLLGMGRFGETGVFTKGPEIIQSVETQYGRVGINICRDMAYASYMKQAGRDGVDIMLSPSYDWPKSPTAWYITSTIENGFSLVRPTYNGYSFAADYHGNQLVHMESDRTEEGIMYADVPLRGIKVLYPLMGDFLGWLSTIIMLVLLGYVIFSKNR